jgi:glycosyltransferase 2 family protein
VNKVDDVNERDRILISQLMKKKRGYLSVFKIDTLKTKLVILPVFLGLLVVGWLFVQEFDSTRFQTVQFNFQSYLFILLGLILMLLRDLGMMMRVNLLTEHKLNWKQLFRINVLSEFTSAVTPAVIGGSSVIALFLHKEGINMGRSISVMFINIFMDELFLILLSPLLFLFIPMKEIFTSSTVIVSSFAYIFTILYFGRLIWTSALYIVLFRHPHLIDKSLRFLFKFPILTRWKNKIETHSSNLMQASVAMIQQTFVFWLKILGCTLLSWSARFLVVNAIFMAFVPVGNHLVVFARQLVLWIVLIVNPTPGGSGVSEYVFKEYYSDFFSSVSVIIVVTMVWRIISYYLYLILGAIIIPGWLKRKR